LGHHKRVGKTTQGVLPGPVHPTPTLMPPSLAPCPAVSAGPPCPRASRSSTAQTLRLPAEGRRWLAHAIEHGLPPRYAAEKLADALAFSLRTADSDRPLTKEPSFAVPTKLVGVG